ncbi:MAG: pyrroline-5-carboxylate reductase [Candidatus Binatia bacterium]
MKQNRSWKTGFIGGGNMASALLRGLVGAGRDPDDIVVSEPDGRRRDSLRRDYGVCVSSDNAEVAALSRTVVLAVKPQVMAEVLSEISDRVGKGTVVVSIAAGVRLASLESALVQGTPVVRVMPNTPCLVGEGMSVYCGGRWVRKEDLDLVGAMLATVGQALELDEEDLLDPVTGLSGSGPAYVYLLAEALARGGQAAGLDREVAVMLAGQTILGAGRMLVESGDGPQALREAVSSPGGTTVAGLGELERRGFATAVAEAVRVATARSRELGGGEG